MPVPTSTSVPAIARTILYRKPSASTSIETRWSVRATARSRSCGRCWSGSASRSRSSGSRAAPGGPGRRGASRSTSRRLADVPAIAQLERAGDRAVVDHVPVPLRPGVERRVERLGHLPASRTRRSRGRSRVQGLDEDLRRVARRREEMDDLAQGVDPGVGPAAGGGRSAGPRSAARWPPRASPGRSAAPAGAASRGSRCRRSSRVSLMFRIGAPGRPGLRSRRRAAGAQARRVPA